METIERAGFFERYKFKISRLERLNVGEVFKDKHDKTFKVVQKEGDFLVFEVDGEQATFDLAPHWERGSNAPIKLNRDGVMNLIGGVFSQAEKDLESFYADGEARFEFEPLVGESREDARKRRKSMYEHAIKECENLLGEVYSKYAKVKPKKHKIPDYPMTETVIIRRDPTVKPTYNLLCRNYTEVRSSSGKVIERGCIVGMDMDYCSKNCAYATNNVCSLRG